MANEVAKASGNVVRTVWRKHGSTIVFVVGVAGLLTAGGLAANGAVKTKKRIEDTDELIKKLRATIGQKKVVDGVESTVTEEDIKPEIKKAKKDLAKGIAKDLGPAVGIAIGATTALGINHAKQQKKISNLTAAAAAFSAQATSMYKEVEKKYGKEEAQMLWAGTKKETKVEEKVDPETGEVNSVEVGNKLTIEIPKDPVFVFSYDATCREWRNERSYNIMTVSQAKTRLTDKLRKRKEVSLEDVLDCFGVDKANRPGYGRIVGKKIKDDQFESVEIDILEDGNNPNLTLLFNFPDILA